MRISADDEKYRSDTHFPEFLVGAGIEASLSAPKTCLKYQAGRKRLWINDSELMTLN